jgi:hypothetical protein
MENKEIMLFHNKLMEQKRLCQEDLEEIEDEKVVVDVSYLHQEINILDKELDIIQQYYNCIDSIEVLEDSLYSKYHPYVSKEEVHTFINEYTERLYELENYILTNIMGNKDDIECVGCKENQMNQLAHTCIGSL